MRKPTFCICENKDADQLRGNREADQRLCFRHTDSAIPLLPKSEISSFYPSSVAVQPGLCRTWSESPKTGFLTTRLIYSCISFRSPSMREHSTPATCHLKQSCFPQPLWRHCSKLLSVPLQRRSSKRNRPFPVP